jgi:hypothetical protein
MSKSLALFLVLTACAWGYPSTNNRSPQIAVADPGSNSLQSLLDNWLGDGTIDAATDQQTAGMFRSSTTIFQVAASVLDFTTGGDTFGIWSDVGSLVPIFLGGATANGVSGPTTGAVLLWDPMGRLTVWALDPSQCGVSIDCQTGLSGIDPGQFGFYLQTPQNTYYTVDQANPNGSAQALTYHANNEWIMAFNDTPVTAGSPGTYNNMVVGVQSITALPEPRSIILLGTTLLLASGFARRRLLRKNKI